MKSSTAVVSRARRGSSNLRIEAIDNWHAGWEGVAAHISQFGKAKKLRVDKEGWLSARQIVTSAFVGRTPVAHVCFTINPTLDGQIEAKLDSYGIDPKFANRGIESQLHQAATERAQALRCTKLKNFRFNSKWC